MTSGESGWREPEGCSYKQGGGVLYMLQPDIAVQYRREPFGFVINKSIILGNENNIGIGVGIAVLDEWIVPGIRDGLHILTE